MKKGEVLGGPNNSHLFDDYQDHLIVFDDSEVPCMEVQALSIRKCSTTGGDIYQDEYYDGNEFGVKEYWRLRNIVQYMKRERK